MLDKAARPATESRALVVQARTLELWHKLGLAAQARTGGTLVRGAKALLDGKDLAPGGLLLDLATYGAGQTPYPEVLVFGQDQTERMLIDALAGHGVAVERDTEVVDLDEHDDHIELRTRHADTEHTVTARYVIGADGAHSVVRHAIGARFDGAAHEGAFFLADTGVEWDRGYGDALTVALDSGGGMTLFVPMRDPGGDRDRFRVFGSLNRDLPAGAAITLADVQRRVDDRTGLVTRLHDPRWIAVYRLSSRMTDVFGRGHAFLAGDAAHIHTPTGGQGMNTGIQDAFNLAWKLSAVLRGYARPALLDSYQAERQPVARALLAGTDAAFATISANGRLTRLLRPVAAAVLPRLLRIPAIGRRAFRTISQITIGYPDSAVVAGDPDPCAGPGDRAPHAPLRGGGTVFDLLTGTDHHLLLFPVVDIDAAAAQQAAQHTVEQARIPIRLHLLDPGERAAHRAYHVRRPAMVLVRPDGYIAWRGALHDTSGLAEYLTRWYLPVAAAASSP